MGSRTIGARLSVLHNVLTAGNQFLELEVDVRHRLSPCRLLSAASGVCFADEDYAYRLKLGEPAATSLGAELVDFSTRFHPRAFVELTFTGRLRFPGKTAPDDLYFTQRFVIPANRPWFEEAITLRNMGHAPVHVRDVAFGFRKRLADTAGGIPVAALRGCALRSLPFQRRQGLRIDRGREAFTALELAEAKPGKLPDYAAEGWSLTDGSHGLLVLKHNGGSIEFSVLKAERLGHAGVLRFGGAGLYRGDPEETAVLEARSSFAFGATRYVLFDGDWMEACRLFREAMDERGHIAPPGYRPKLFWNVLYNCGWEVTTPPGPSYSRDDLEAEAVRAKAAGCEALYLDPRWDTVEGSTKWDTKRLGRQRAFAEHLGTKHGLDLALHTMQNTNSATEYAGLYRTDERGEIASCWKLRAPCTASAWLDEKVKRLHRLCRDGASWLMIDFTDFLPGTECHDRAHGHPVPSRRIDHANGLLGLYQGVKSKHPDVLLEAHDRIASGPQDYHPMHFQHGLPGSFDELWGFELMWDCMNDLTSGRAETLYHYNLCYSIPMYLHVNLGQDNDNLLVFWWYASLVRRLGIGGVKDVRSDYFKKLKAAVKVYKRLRRYYTHGTFWGIDPHAHVHVLPGRGAVINLFNLAGRKRTLRKALDLGRVGLVASKDLTVDGAQWALKGSRLTIKAPVPAMAPHLVEVKV
ncbi:MAG: hypothetical protein JW889_02885 [Verrucomicrobia bacterium]|nr:hypothetical protein [Verrucomicrobiota bacterium]